MASVIKGSVDFYEHVFVNTTGQKKNSKFPKKCFLDRNKLFQIQELTTSGSLWREVHYVLF